MTMTNLTTAQVARHLRDHYRAMRDGIAGAHEFNEARTVSALRLTCETVAALAADRLNHLLRRTR